MASDDSHTTKRQETEQEQAASLLQIWCTRSLLSQNLKKSSHMGRTLHLPVTLNRVPCQITLAGLAQHSHFSMLSPLFHFGFALLGTSLSVAMGYERKQPLHLPWFHMNVRPAWFFIYARPRKKIGHLSAACKMVWQQGSLSVRELAWNWQQNWQPYSQPHCGTGSRNNWGTKLNRVPTPSRHQFC